MGPGPHAAMMLGDWGADVVRVVRPGADGAPDDLLGESQLRNRTVVAADLKDPEQVRSVQELIRHTDVLIEGFRPGVAEKAGLSPDACWTVNPRLVYARMTGWGQDGPRAHTAGHDINYLSVTGMLDAIGAADRPAVPLNLVGDFGGGSMLLLSAVLAALLERGRSGAGQVLDVAIVDGVTTLAQQIWSIRAMGAWDENRVSNILDGGSPVYGVYECADGRFLAVGAIEHKFSRLFFDGLGLDTAEIPDRDDREHWSELRRIIGETVRTRTRDEWCALFDGTDACVTPVLTMSEAVHDRQVKARNLLGDIDGLHQTLPPPIFSRTTCDAPEPPNSRLMSVADAVARWNAN